jgi:hypothetical protein
MKTTTTTDTPRTETCPHPKDRLMLLGSHWKWCSLCGAAQRRVDGKPFGNWQIPELAEDVSSFIRFLDNNLGATADWPMEANFDDEETSETFCGHLNAMKRVVNPNAIKL